MSDGLLVTSAPHVAEDTPDSVLADLTENETEWESGTVAAHAMLYHWTRLLVPLKMGE
jgi:hypothetical protein